jgi:hypothetical protein
MSKDRCSVAAVCALLGLFLLRQLPAGKFNMKISSQTCGPGRVPCRGGGSLPASIRRQRQSSQQPAAGLFNQDQTRSDLVKKALRGQKEKKKPFPVSGADVGFKYLPPARRLDLTYLRRIVLWMWARDKIQVEQPAVCSCQRNSSVIGHRFWASALCPYYYRRHHNSILLQLLPFAPIA